MLVCLDAFHAQTGQVADRLRPSGDLGTGLRSCLEAPRGAMVAPSMVTHPIIEPPVRTGNRSERFPTVPRLPWASILWEEKTAVDVEFAEPERHVRAGLACVEQGRALQPNALRR